MAICLIIASAFMFCGCGDLKVTTAVSFGFKTDGSTAGSYDESITVFEIGKKF